MTDHAPQPPPRGNKPRKNIEDAIGVVFNQRDRIASLEAENAALRERLTETEAVIEADRTRIIDVVNAVEKVVNGKFWLTEGRGSYEWSDDRYRKEFGEAVRSMLTAVEPLRKIGADLKHCPQTTAEVIEARRDLRERLATAQREAEEAQGIIASSTDLANTWARELGVREDADGKGLQRLIDRIWSEASGKWGKALDRTAELEGQLAEAQERLAMAVEALPKLEHLAAKAATAECDVMAEPPTSGPFGSMLPPRAALLARAKRAWGEFDEVSKAALAATAASVAQHTAEVERRGAAKELRRISQTSIHTITLYPNASGPGKDHRLVLCEALEARAEELRRQP